MPGPVAQFAARQQRQQITTAAAPGTALAIRPADRSARELQEKVVALEWRYRFAGRSIFPPWLDNLNCSPAVLRRNLAAMLADSVAKPALLGKTYAVASLDAQMTPADETPRDEEVAAMCLYAYTTAINGGIPKMVHATLLHKWIFGDVVCEMVWYPDLWPRGKWAGRRFFRDLKARADAVPKWDEFGNLESVTGRTADGESETWTEGDGLEDFLVMKHLPLFEGQGQSDLLAAYQLVWERYTIERLRDVHLDKFVSPYVVVTTGIGGAPIVINDPDTNEQAAIEKVIEPHVQAIKSRGYGIMPPGVDVHALQLATRGEAEFQAAMDKKDEKIALSISGAFLQMLTTNGIGQMRGNAETQRNTAELFAWAGMVEFCGAVNTRMTPRLVLENFGDGVDYPLLSLGGINTADAKQTADLYAVAVQANVRPSRKAFSKATGIQLATTPDDELLPPTVSPLPPGTPGTIATPGVSPFLPAAGPSSQDAAAATGDVQATALNGAQIASLLEVVGQVAQKQLPPASATAILTAAFPLMDQATIQRIVGGLAAFRPGPQVVQQFAESVVAEALKKKLTRLEVPTRYSSVLPPKPDNPAKS